MNILSILASPLTTIANAFLEIRKIKAEGAVRKAEAKVEKEVRIIQNQADYDTTAMKASESSWKDEYLVIILSMPFIGSFIPGVQDHMAKGWDYVAKAPEWYQWCFYGAIIATFGLRWMFNKKMPSPTK